MSAATHVYPYDERPEVGPYVPTCTQRLLDVGCSRGGFGAGLRRQRPDLQLVGIESDAAAAREAAAFYDEMICGHFPQDVPSSNPFDCVVFNDVLEHLVDPWSALRAAVPLLGTGGTVVASIPNVRALRPLVELAVRGDWHYRDMGILDRTHLRFFTKRSMLRLFDESGFDVISINGIFPLGNRWHLAPILTCVMRDIAYLEFVVVAQPRG